MYQSSKQSRKAVQQPSIYAEVITTWGKRWRLILITAGCGIFALLAIPLSSIKAQSRAASAPLVPLPDPGYSLYYHDQAGAPNVAARWGYHDGWQDGRHDRNHGDSYKVIDKERYAMPPEHGGHPGMTRDQYERVYRAAYTHGYEHGSRL